MKGSVAAGRIWSGIVGSTLLAVVIAVTGSVVLARQGAKPADPPEGRVYKNLFEYRMCLAHDSNWCPNGDDFKATLFDNMYINPDLGSDPDYFWGSGDEMKPHYPTSTVGSLTRYTADFCEAGSPELDGTCPDVYGYDVVRCLDGTRPVFYYEPGHGADADKWLFKIQGGGEQCSERCPVKILRPDMRHHFSSAYNENAERRHASGIFSNNDDNAFKDYNIVMLDKCFGDRNQGDTTYTDVFSGALGIEDGSGPVYFHGYRVILATLRRLKRDFDLADAEHIVFATQSNGSNGAYTYIDRLSDHVSSNMGIGAPVYLLAQSFVAPGPEVEYYFGNGSWPVNYTDIPTSTEIGPGIINAPNTPPEEACGPGFDPADPYYSRWILEGRTPSGGATCDRDDPVEADGGVHGKAYATDSFQDGVEAEDFRIWGADNGTTVTWDESCVEAHASDPDLRACRDSRHVMVHHLQTPTFFAAQLADRNLRSTSAHLTMWSPEGTVWWPEDFKLRVEKLAEVISGYESRSACADEDLGAHGFFIDNTVDHMAVSDMPKLTRKMKANVGEEEGFNFQLQHYLKYWLHPSAPTVQCLDSNDLYDVEFDPPDVVPSSITYPVEEWPPLVQCRTGYYPGGSQPYQDCDDPGFADPSNPTLNKADDRWICQGPPILEYVYLPMVIESGPIVAVSHGEDAND
jgi:hypothetical protein